MHKKVELSTTVGGQVACGSRKLKIDTVNGDLVHVTITKKQGETVEIRDPRQRDQSWILTDPGEGEMEGLSQTVTIGHKIRIGNFRQFRIVGVKDDNIDVVVIGPTEDFD